MSEITTSFTKDSDYEVTKHVVTKSILENVGGSYSTQMKQGKSISKTFNFHAGKITTLYRHTIYQASKYEGGGAAASTALQVTTEYFNDQPLQLEIEQMHKELKKMGGKPPELNVLQAAYMPGRKF